MSLELPFGIKVTKASSNVDELYGPYPSIEEALIAVPKELRAIGRVVGITEDDTVIDYVWGNGVEDENLVVKTSKSNSVIISDIEPEKTEAVWVDNSDLFPDPSDESDTITELRSEISNLIDRMEAVEYRFDYSMDSGGFSNKAGSTQFAGYNAIEPGAYNDPTFNPNAVTDDNPDDSPNDGNDLGEGDGTEPDYNPDAANVKHIRIKRGLQQSFKLDALQDGELGYVKDKNLLYIGNDGTARLIGSGGSSGGNNGGGATLDGAVPYIDILSDNEEDQLTYRVRVDSEGFIYSYDSRVDDALDQQVNTPGKEELKGLYISMLYAGGVDEGESIENPCSHNFVEIFNASERTITLNGVSLQYSNTTGSDWVALELKGVLKPKHAFLIRGARCAPELNTTLVEIDDYDLDFPDMRLSNQHVKLYLHVGRVAIDIPNPNNTNNAPNTFLDGYIDLVGIGGLNNGQVIDAYEGAAPNILTNKRCIYRLYFADYNQRPAGGPWGDLNANNKDMTYIEYNKSFNLDYTKIYKPWTSKMGIKDIYFDKNNWHLDKPNMVTNSFGRDASKTRTFNWVSVGYYDEYLQYRLEGESDWITIESIKDSNSYYKRILVKGFNGTYFTVHKQIITNLEAGKYEFRVGRLNTDYWSDILHFEILALDHTSPFGYVMTADQQAWNWREYEPWRRAAEAAAKWETDQDPNYPATGDKKIHFHFNVGDMTENGIRPHEWLYYYEAGAALNYNYAQMNVVGNNDLCPNPGEFIGKINPDSFEWFYCYEHNPDNVPLLPNGDVMKAVYSYDYGCVHFVVLNTNNYIEEQKAWFIKDMQEVHSRDNKPRWIIVGMHDACFNIITDATKTRDTGFNQFADPDLQKRYSWSRLFEEWGVSMVMSGHKHTYSRTKKLLEKVDEDGVVIPLQPIEDDPRGIVYLMSQATGSKQSSNKDVPGTAISWLDFYFEGTGEGDARKSNPAQQFLTYIKIDVDMDKITHHSYQVVNAMPQGDYTYDPYNIPKDPLMRREIDTSTIDRAFGKFEDLPIPN